MDVERLYARLETRALGRRTEAFGSIDSTQSEAERRVARGEAEHGLVLVAEHQTSGRGTSGRAWVSAGANLLFTVVLRDEAYPLTYAFLPGVACAEALRADFGVDAHVKWVNDVLAGEGFRKICGTLITRPAGGFLVVGMGVNVNQTAWDERDVHATSIRLETGVEHAVEDVLAAVLLRLEAVFGRTTAAMNPATHAVAEHRKLTRLIGKWVPARSNGARERVQVVDVLDTGELALRTEAGEERTVVAATGFQLELAALGEA